MVDSYLAHHRPAAEGLMYRRASRSSTASSPFGVLPSEAEAEAGAYAHMPCGESPLFQLVGLGLLVCILENPVKAGAEAAASLVGV